MLASASHDSTIKLWDAATGAERQTLEGHTGSANAVAFSPDKGVRADLDSPGVLPCQVRRVRGQRQMQSVSHVHLLPPGDFQ